ncbi:hypothetical protein BVRB_5g099070 [Beta vulgaris subsp. vulgaris]|nr:hypothetical protein BVRB_5g099070 [Beta vulgaris subsp. vulgaris]
MAPTQQQRLEQLEQDFNGLHAAFTEMLNNQQGLGERLEGRMNRARENTELLLGQLRDEQRKFQEDIKTSLLTLKATMPEAKPSLTDAECTGPPLNLSFNLGNHVKISLHNG